MSDAVESKEKHPFYSRLRPQDGDRTPSYSRLPWWLFCCAVIIVIAARTSVAEEDVAKEGNNPDRNSPHAFVAKVALLLAMLSFCMVMVNLLATDRYSPLNVWNPQVWWSCWAWFLGLY